MIESTVRGKNCYSRVVSGEKYTPMSLYRKLGGIALLESASFGMGRGRHSLLLVKEAFTIVDEGGRISLSTREGRERWEGEGDILDACMAYARFHENSEGRGDQPFPAGGIGYLSYEYVRNFEEVELREKPDSLGIPDACFVFGHLFLIFDHYRDTITILGLNYPGHEISLERAVDEVEHRLHDLDFNYMNTSRRQYESVSLVGEGEEERFLDGVVRVRREIEKGNLLQGVLSRRLIVRTELPSLEAYGRLRSLNPSPYMFFLDFGDFQFFGSSPEIHVKVEGRRVISRPIAGTRPRGKDRAEDLVLEEELLADEKERAEHLMLVDLARNDIGRVCEPGSVKVTEYMGIERYSHVMHIVSQVEGTLAAGVPGVEAIRKTFPAGTVSGAPKIMAMEIIDSLERDKRGFYAGVVGYMEPDGSLDTCIAIRSGLKRDDLLTLQAGAGIVYDSVPQREYAETAAKLRAFGASLGVEV